MKLKHLTLVLMAAGLSLTSARAQQPTPPEPPKPPQQIGDLPKPVPPPNNPDQAPSPRDGERRDARPDNAPREGAPREGERRPENGPRDGDRRDNDHRNREHEREPGRSHQEMRATPYIGVFARPLSDEVRAQTGVPEGFGLIIEEVMPESPAKEAGLKQHDVLVLLGDQRLVNQEQLSALVRAEKKDAVLTFTITRAGAEQKVTVKVGEKMMPVADIERSGPFHPFVEGLRDMVGGSPEAMERLQREMREQGERLQREMREKGGNLREQGERFRERMQDFGDRMRDWARDPRGRPQPQSPRFDDNNNERRDNHPGAQNREGDRRPEGRPPGDRVESRSDSTSFQRNVTRRDDSGTYTLSENNGAKVFTAKPSQGEEQTFIVNTEQQRQAIPEPLRDKLRELENLDTKGGAARPGEVPPPPR